LSLLSGQPSLVCIISLPTLSGAINRRASPINNRLSTLQTLPRLACLCRRFHGKGLARRGVSRRNTATAHNRRGWRRPDVSGDTAKIDSTKNITINWRWWPAPLAIVDWNMPQSVLKAIGGMQIRHRKHNKKPYQRYKLLFVLLIRVNRPGLRHGHSIHPVTFLRRWNPSAMSEAATA